MIESDWAWTPAVAAVAYFGHRVAIRWLNVREQEQIRGEFRDERDKGAVAACVAKVDAIEAELKAMRTEQKAFIANNRR